jgi:hypothetical protein
MFGILNYGEKLLILSSFKGGGFCLFRFMLFGATVILTAALFFMNLELSENSNAVKFLV